MINDHLSKYDGFQAITQGVDSGRAPAVLDRTQLSWLVNGTTRGNLGVTCRPGVKPRVLQFVDATGAVDATVQAAFQTGGRYQGASGYLADSGAARVIVSIGGHLFNIDLATYNTQDLTSGLGDYNSAKAPLSWFVQAENYLIIQNAEDKAFIYNGSGLRRALPGTLGGNEVPIGSVMQYNNGRLVVASPDGHFFVAGDLVYSHPDAEGGGRGSLLQFTENTFLNGGGSFSIPATAGGIRAMTNIAIQDSATGQGPLQIFTTKGAFSINLPFDRTTWQNTTSPIQSISLLAAGSVSQFATANVNGDIWFRSNDGVRSFMIARRDQGTWTNTPLSNEVRRALHFDTPELLPFASAALFDNRLLTTCSPFQITEDGSIRGVGHRGLVALDFDPVSSMFNRDNPTWEGIWTGLTILQILTVETANTTRCLIFALNSDSEVELWEMTKDDRFDSGDNPIQWAFETPEYGFDDGGWNLKQLGYSDLWIDRMAGTINFQARYRDDSYPFWLNLHTWAVCAEYKDCDTTSCATFETRQEQYRARIRLPAPSMASCDEASGKPHPQGYRFAMRVDATGYCRIRQLRLIARSLPEDAEGSCPPADAVCETNYEGCAPENDFSYVTLP